MQATKAQKFFSIFVTFALVLQMFAGGGWLTSQAWADDGGTIVVNNTTLSPSVGVYTDSNHTNKADASGTTVKPGDTLYGQWKVTFTEDYKPTAAATTVIYNLPSNITVKDYKTNVDLYDDNTNTLAGTWSLVKGENGNPDQIVLHYNESYLASHSENIQAHVDFDFTMNKSGLKEGNTEPISFFGNADPITITIGDSGVTGSKSAGSYDPTTGKVSWTITLNPAAATDNVTITDTLGDNLSFDEGSFTVSKDYGTATAVTDVTVSGQQATINLGSLEKGRYDIKYTTSVSESALEGLQNGQNVSNVGNSMQWSWGDTPGKHESSVVTADGPAISYDMIGSKGAASGSTSENIKWVVTLNNGNLKANMAGYKFTDTLQDTDKHEYTGSYVVKDASGNQVATGDLSASDTSFTYTFGADATAQKYTIEYSTKFKTGTSASATVKNTATVEGDLSDSATGQFTGTDTTTYLTKELTDDSQKNSGVAKWSSTITSSAMDAGTSSLVYTDHLQTVSSAETTYSDITVKVVDGDELTEGADYTVTQGKEAAWYTYSSLTITFTTDGLAKFMGASDVEVSYTTTTTDTVNGTYTNYASIQNTNWNAQANYVIDSNAPALEKPEGKVAWDANYMWDDDTKGAWVTTWTVIANHAGTNTQGANLAGKTISIIDDLAGMDYVAGSASFKLTNNNNSGDGISQWTATSVTPTFDDNGKATFTWEVTGYSGSAYHDCVTLEYKTAIKASDSKLPAATATTFTNKASGSAGDIAFPEGTGTTTITNKVLDKKGAGYTDTQGDHVYDKDSNTAKYTVDVNQAALDLDADSDTLTLTDTLSAAGTFLPSTLKVVNADTQAAVDYKVSVEDGENGATKIVLTVPDAQHLTITYSVRPNASAGENVTLSNTVEFTGITGSSAGKEDSFDVVNASGGTSGDTGTITVTKYDADSITTLLQGATFKLYSVDLDTGNRTEVKTATTNASGVATFEEVAADTLYVVVETAAPSGYTKSDKETYIVRRAKDASGNFTDAETYANIIAKAKTLGIENISTNLAASYFDEKGGAVTGSATITAAKTLTGATLAADQFSFTLQEVDVNGLAVENGVSEIKTNDADGNVTFSELTNLAVGTHYYTVSEVVPEDADKAAGITYDSTVYNVTVTVAEDGTTTVAYTKDGADAEGAAFSNSYAPESGSCSIDITKTVNGANPKEGETFTFELLDEQGNRVEGTQEVTTAADGKATITGLTFTKAGSYIYKVHETSQDGNGWTNADDFTVTVSVVDDNGKLVATPNYGEGNNSALMNNTYTAASGEFQLSLVKTVNSATPASGQTFEFSATATGDNAESAPALENVTTGADGKATFAKVTLGDADAGKTYTYTISEVSTLGTGWTKAPDVTATVTVGTRDANNNLPVTVKYNGTESQAAQFNNTYAPEGGSCSIDITKTVNGANPKEGETFTFELLDEQGNRVQGTSEVTTNADGKATISGLTFTEAGTYTYKVHETSQDGSGWVNADDFTVTVSVVDNDGTLVATPSYGEGNNSALMDNTYTAASGEFQLSLVKTVNSATPASGQTFEFSATATGDNASSAPKLDNVTTDAEGKASFAKVTLGDADAGKTYTYTISEVSTLGTGWTKAADVTATVTVGTRDANNKLNPTITYNGTESAAAQFNNTYQPAAQKAAITITKTVNGANPKDDEQFTFELSAVNNAPMPATAEGAKVTTKGAASASFGEIEYTTAGTYKYIIHETTQVTLGDGWTNAGDIEAVVNVTDDNGKLVATVDYTGSAKPGSYVFDNTYKHVNDAEATIAVSKKVAGDNAQPDEKFTFELYKAKEDGTRGDKVEGVDTIELTADQTANFKNLKFTEEGTYKYIIHETSDNGAGWTNAQDVTATVTVTDDRKGSLQATVEYSTEKDNAAFFENQYSQPKSAEPTISVNKKVAGDNPQAEETFTFELQDKDGKKIDGVDTITLKADETKSFEGLKLNEEGTFTYTIHETSDNGAGWTNAQDVTATVVVKYNKSANAYEVESVEYSTPNEEKNAAFFENVFKSGKATISVSKKVAGDNAQPDEKFTFELQDENGKKIEGVKTIELKADETKSFEGLEFTKEGTYKYIIHETSENGEGWTNAQDVTATVTVTKGENNELVVKVEYSTTEDGGNSAFFLNKYEQPETPTTPEQPTTPSSDTPKTQDATPKTGDENPMGLFAGLATVSALAVGGSAYGMRRARKNNR